MPPSNYDLFANAASRSKVASSPLTVTEVNQKVNRLLEQRMSKVAVIGEVSNLKVVSGHYYFALKDASSSLPAALFRREASRVKFELENGLEVVVTGKLSLYVPYGRYQIIADSIEPKGVGSLQLAFEQLKAKLQREGLFDSGKKRQMPFLPRRIAVVTSRAGAVLRDIIHVSTRRYSNAQILLIPSRVQGAEAASTIAAGINRASRLASELGLDALIVGRGGGSMEDLWGYNDEEVARAIADCSIPVVSAVGHETDFTIADFVADLRAPTPSAAAEILFPLKSDLVGQLVRFREELTKSCRARIRESRVRVEMGRRTLGDGRPLIREYTQRFSFLQERIRADTTDLLRRSRLQLGALEGKLERLHPRVGLLDTRAKLHDLEKCYRLLINQKLHEQKQKLAGLAGRLNALSPLGVLERGYSIILDSNGRALVDSSAVEIGDELDIRLANGNLQAEVIRSNRSA